jgi:hypothetical protein
MGTDLNGPVAGIRDGDDERGSARIDFYVAVGWEDFAGNHGFSFTQSDYGR